jgi:hypothetical protein
VCACVFVLEGGGVEKWTLFLSPTLYSFSSPDAILVKSASTNISSVPPVSPLGSWSCDDVRSFRSAARLFVSLRSSLPGQAAGRRASHRWLYGSADAWHNFCMPCTCIMNAWLKGGRLEGQVRYRQLAGRGPHLAPTTSVPETCTRFMWHQQWPVVYHWDVDVVPLGCESVCGCWQTHTNVPV